MLNLMALQGRLTRDPETKNTQNGKSVTSFTVAWSEKYGDRESVLFLDCAAWGSMGDFISHYFSKGQEIVVHGKIVTESWTDKEGQKRSKVRMPMVERAHFCGPKQGAQGDYSQASGDDFIEIQDDSELPF